MRHRLLSVLFLLLPVPLIAQLDLTARLDESRHASQASAPEIGDGPSIRPLADLGPGLEVGIRRGDWRASVGAARITHDLVLQGGDAGIITPDVLRGLDVAVQIGRPILRNGGASLELAAGVIGTRWSFVGLSDPSRWRWGPIASLAGLLPLSGHLSAVTRLGLSRAGGIFTNEEIPEGYERASATRFEWSVGIRLGKR